MDFFEYAAIAGDIAPTKLWVQLLIGGLCFAIVFVFEAIALYTIATKNGYKNKWMAFIPFLNTYYIGVCAQKNKFYNVNTKTIGLATAILEAVLVGLCIVSLVANILIQDYLVPDEDAAWMFGNIYRVDFHAVPSELRWAAWVYTYMDTYIVFILQLVYIVLEVILLICFFQTYACRRYVLFTVTSILFPIMGILFFIVRNNSAVNYKDFIRAEQARQYQQYQQFRQQNYNNPYNQNYNQNPYNRNPYNQNGGGSGSDPFDNLGNNSNGNNSSQSDPFEDFDK